MASAADARIRKIENELQQLSVDHHPNAVSLLSRVFVELSVDAYIASHSLPVPKSSKLRHKIQHVLVDLVKRQKLTSEQAHPLRTALQKDSFLAPSIDMLNDYVHTGLVYPAPADLRAHWNAMRSFFAAVWS